MIRIPRRTGQQGHPEKNANFSSFSSFSLFPSPAVNCSQSASRGVAQPGSATVLGTVGRKFESCRPDHLPEKVKANDAGHKSGLSCCNCLWESPLRVSLFR